MHTPRALADANASRIRWEIIRRSFSARVATPEVRASGSQAVWTCQGKSASRPLNKRQALFQFPVRKQLGLRNYLPASSEANVVPPIAPMVVCGLRHGACARERAGNEPRNCRLRAQT